MPCWAGDRSTSMSIRAESALTTESADAVQAAGGDVRAAAELAAGVQLGEDHLDAGEPGLGLLVDRDAAAVVVDLGRAVGVQGDLDPVRGAGQRLVDAVVDDLPQAVHQPAGVGRADVHAGALAHRLEALEDEEVCGVVRVVDRGAACMGKSGAPAPNLPASDTCRRDAVPTATAPRGSGPSVTREDTSRRGHDRCSGPSQRNGHGSMASHVSTDVVARQGLGSRHGNLPSGYDIRDWMTCQAPRGTPGIFGPRGYVGPDTDDEK